MIRALLKPSTLLCLMVCLCSLLSCKSEATLRVQLPEGWTENWLLYQRSLDNVVEEPTIDTLFPVHQQLTWNPSQTENMEVVLIPVSGPIQNIKERIPYKIHLYLYAEEQAQVMVTGSPEAFQYKILQGSNLNRGVCDFINLYAPRLNDEFQANQRLFMTITQATQKKVRIDTILGAYQQIVQANRQFVREYYKAHYRESGSEHAWLEIPKSEARAMEVLIPNKIRNGLLKSRIDQHLD